MVKILNTFFSFILFFLLLFFALILALGKNFSLLTLEGINLWLALVVPSLFPYFFITAILSSLKITNKLSNCFFPLTKRLFNVGGAVGYAFFMSLLCGYPVGAKLVCDLKHKNLISQSESIRASALCSTSSPMFLINSVGFLMFKNIKIGIILFCCHFISAIIVGIIFSFYDKKTAPLNTAYLDDNKVDNVLYESAYSSVVSILVVGAIITIFYIFSNLLFSLGILNPLISFLTLILKDINLAKGLIFGLLECTQGLKILSGLNSFIAIPLCSFLSGFGGLSVIMQSLAYLKKAKIKTTPFILAKVLSAVLNFCICFISCLIFQPL